MANNARFVTNSTAATNQNDNFEEAKGFLNLSLEFDNGEVHRLSKKGIPLLESDPIHNLLIQILSQDPSKAQALVSRLKITYGQRANVATQNLTLSL